MSSFAIIVPCYNEERRLNTSAFLQFSSSHPEIHFYFVNDGSSDKTFSVLKEMQDQSESIFLIDLAKNYGKGEAIRRALMKLSSQYIYIGYLDADLSTSIEEFYSLYQKLRGKTVSVIFGSRIKKADTVINRSYARHLIGRSIATIIDKRFNLGCYDTQCGAKIFSSAILKNIIQQPFFTKWFFDVELFLRIKKEYGQINALEVPLSVWLNVKGSKLNVLSFPSVLRELFLLLTKY